MNENLNKVRRLLDYKKYHLCEEYNGIDSKWKLYEKYETRMEDGSGPIMTSETHTEEDLIKFAKEHRTYKFIDISKTLVIISFVNLAILILGIMLKNEYLQALVTGSNLCIILMSVVVRFMDSRNFKVDFLETKARIKRNIARAERKIKEYESKREDN